MQKIDIATSISIKLSPGDVMFFVVGKSKEVKSEVAQIWKNRCQREQARYLLSAELARKNGLNIPVVPAGSDADAYKKIMLAQKKRQKIIDASEFGQMLIRWKKAENELGKIDYVLRKNIDLFASEKVRKATPHYRSFPLPKNPALRNILKINRRNRFDYWKLNHEIDNGKYLENKAQIEALFTAIPRDIKTTMQVIANAKK